MEITIADLGALMPRPFIKRCLDAYRIRIAFVFARTTEVTIHDAAITAGQQDDVAAMAPETALLDAVVLASELDARPGAAVREVDAGNRDVLAGQPEPVRHVRPEKALRPDDDRLVGGPAGRDPELITAERTAVAGDDHVAGARIVYGAGELRIVRDIDLPALRRGVADQRGVAGQKRQCCRTQEQVAPGQC